MRGVDDQYSVEDLAAYAADPTFHDRVHPRCLRSGEHNPAAAIRTTSSRIVGRIGGRPGWVRL
jgi:hypothetical protein